MKLFLNSSILNNVRHSFGLIFNGKGLNIDETDMDLQTISTLSYPVASRGHIFFRGKEI